MAIGISTDPFAAFTTANDFMKLQSVQQDGQGSNAQAPDEYGDIACETVFNFPGGRSLTATYQGCVPKTQEEINFDTLKIGTLYTYDGKKYIITGVDVSKSQGSPVEVTVNAVGVVSTADQSDFNMYTWYTNLTIQNGLGINETAETLGVESGASSSLQSVSISASASIATVQDESGELACSQVYAGRVEISGDVISCTESEPTITADSNFTAQNEASISLANAEYPTARRMRPALAWQTLSIRRQA